MQHRSTTFVETLQDEAKIMNMKVLANMKQQKVSAKNLVDEIVHDLDNHMQNAEQFDDITIATVIL